MLSGDPFLPQVTARSTEFGMRGTLPNGWEWNGSVYRTNLYDDLYFVGGSLGQGSFQSIGDTRRQGIELGLGGRLNRWLDFSMNYGLTEATFESPLYSISERNSSRLLEGPGGGENPGYIPDHFDPVTGRALVQQEDMIAVQPGDRLPGVPLHNLNATLSFHPLDRWELNLNMIAHSSAYVRGNENNDHRAGVFEYVDEDASSPTPRTERYSYGGKVGGYAVFNLRSSYKVDSRLTVFGQLNNLLDKEYFSAGRLGVNPFSPSVNGAIGESGWNYNSDEWLPTTFIAPGAPRAFWIGVEYRF
jgi:outer membrane receptor protein involved in Fe transport